MIGSSIFEEFGWSTVESNISVTLADGFTKTVFSVKGVTDWQNNPYADIIYSYADIQVL